MSFEKYLTEYENQISKLKNFDTSKMKVEDLTEFNNLGVTAIEATYEDLKKQSYDAIYELQIRIKELLKEDDLRIKDNYREMEKSLQKMKRELMNDEEEGKRMKMEKEKFKKLDEISEGVEKLLSNVQTDAEKEEDRKNTIEKEYRVYKTRYDNLLERNRMKDPVYKAKKEEEKRREEERKEREAKEEADRKRRQEQYEREEAKTKKVKLIAYISVGVLVGVLLIVAIIKNS